MDELEALAAYRNMDLESFTNLYIRTADGKLALQQRKINGEYLCCFFDPFEERCKVYPLRPEQCRTYPFWEDFQDDFRALLNECPGVKQFFE
jgi:Fe-S-cluster containining protein